MIKKRSPIHVVSRIFLVAILFFACKKESLLVHKIKPELVIRSDNPALLAKDLVFSSDTVYNLTTSLVRDSGQSMTIEPGTLFRVQLGVSVTIRKGAVIHATGTAEAPIIFTSNNSAGGSGSVCGGCTSDQFWNGIWIFGNAADSGSATSSGSLSYLRIEFAGNTASSYQYAALYLQDISKATIVNNIEISYAGGRSAYGIYGGDLEAKNLISYASIYNDFELGMGYRGKLQNLVAYRHPYFGAPITVDRNLAGLLIEDAQTYPLISNASILGPDNRNGTVVNYSLTESSRGAESRVAALVVRNAAGFEISNSVFMGFPKGGFYMNSQPSAHSFENEFSGFTHSIVHSNDSSRAFVLPDGVYPPYTAGDFKSFTLRPQYANAQFLQSADFGFTDPMHNDYLPFFLPGSDSPLQEGAAFEGVFEDPFFDKVSYRGAFGTLNWMEGWTSFTPLQTNYNE